MKIHDSSQVNASRVSSHPPLVCSPLSCLDTVFFSARVFAALSSARPPSVCLNQGTGGYLTWHQVSVALFTHGLRHIRTVFVAEMNQQSNFVIQPGVKMLQVCPACLCL